MSVSKIYFVINQYSKPKGKRSKINPPKSSLVLTFQNYMAVKMVSNFPRVI